MPENFERKAAKDDRNREVFVDGLRRLEMTREEEEEQKKTTAELLEKRRFQEDKFWQVFEDDVQSWEPIKKKG